MALNKVDVPDARELATMVRRDLEARGMTVLAVSAATHEGLRDLSFAMARVVGERRATTPVSAPTRVVLRPPAVGGEAYTIERVDGRWRVRGEKPERWVRQTDFGNDEAVGYLADRLARLGVEQALLERGAAPGDDVVIGEEGNAVVFDFDPTVQAGAELLPGRRGQDPRVEGR